MWPLVWKRWHATSLLNGHSYCPFFCYYVYLGITYSVIWCIMPSINSISSLEGVIYRFEWLYLQIQSPPFQVTVPFGHLTLLNSLDCRNHVASALSLFQKIWFGQTLVGRLVCAILAHKVINGFSCKTFWYAVDVI